MLLTLFTAVALAAGPAQMTVGGSGWEKVFEASAAEGFVTAVWAANRDEWFVGGKRGVTRVTKSGQEMRNTRSPVAGLFGETPKSVFALGYDELVLHFNGKAWSEEHYVATAKRGARDYDDLVQLAFYVPGDPRATLTAFGPHAVLQREINGTWRAPSEPERERLSSLAETGPAERPAGCAADGWFWIGKDLAWFVCQDGRTFIRDRGQVMPKGRIPRACPTRTRAAFDGSEIYVACHDRGVWRTDGKTWRRLPRFAGQDQATFDISVADKCVFVTTKHAVWRRCEP
ncbi:MAG: hypothetical protein ACJ8F1_08730 [Polyangia bacterium]